MVRLYFVRIEPICFSAWWRRVEIEIRRVPIQRERVRHVDGSISKPVDDDGKERLVSARTDTFNRLCQKRITKERCFSTKLTRQDNKCKWMGERERKENRSCHSSTLLLCNAHHSLREQRRQETSASTYWMMINIFLGNSLCSHYS